MLLCSVPGCDFVTISLPGLSIPQNVCYRKLARQVEPAAQGTAAPGAGARQRNGQAQSCTEPEDGAECLEVTRLGTLPEQSMDATAQAANDMATAPAAPLDPPELRELAPAFGRAARSALPPQACTLGQQGAYQAVQLPWPPTWGLKLSDGGSAAGCGPVLCREQPAAHRQPPRPALTALQVELFQVARQLPQSAQTELLRVVDDMLRANERVGFRTVRAVKAALDAEQVAPFDAAPARDINATYLLMPPGPAHVEACGWAWVLATRGRACRAHASTHATFLLTCTACSAGFNRSQAGRCRARLWAHRH